MQCYRKLINCEGQLFSDKAALKTTSDKLLTNLNKTLEQENSQLETLKKNLTQVDNALKENEIQCVKLQEQLTNLVKTKDESQEKSILRTILNLKYDHYLLKEKKEAVEKSINLKTDRIKNYNTTLIKKSLEQKKSGLEAKINENEIQKTHLQQQLSLLTEPFRLLILAKCNNVLTDDFFTSFNQWEPITREWFTKTLNRFFELKDLTTSTFNFILNLTKIKKSTLIDPHFIVRLKQLKFKPTDQKLQEILLDEKCDNPISTIQQACLADYCEKRKNRGHTLFGIPMQTKIDVAKKIGNSLTNPQSTYSLKPEEQQALKEGQLGNLLTQLGLSIYPNKS